MEGQEEEDGCCRRHVRSCVARHCSFQEVEAELCQIVPEVLFYAHSSFSAGRESICPFWTLSGSQVSHDDARVEPGFHLGSSAPEVEYDGRAGFVRVKLRTARRSGTGETTFSYDLVDSAESSEQVGTRYSGRIIMAPITQTKSLFLSWEIFNECGICGATTANAGLRCLKLICCLLGAAAQLSDSCLCESAFARLSNDIVRGQDWICSVKTKGPSRTLLCDMVCFASRCIARAVSREAFFRMQERSPTVLTPSCTKESAPHEKPRLSFAAKFQVGGNHANVHFLPGGLVAKILTKPKLRLSETRWYKSQQGELLSSFMPHLWGCIGPTLVLQDVCDFEGPFSVMDIKLGTCTHMEPLLAHEPTSTDRYVKKMQNLFKINRKSCSKYEYMEFRDQSTTSRQYGFRVTDMAVAKYHCVCADAAIEETSKMNGVFRGYFSLPAPNNARGLAWYESLGNNEALLRTLVYFFHDGVKFHVAAASNVLEKLRRFTAALSASAVGRGAVTIAGSSILIVHSRTMSSSCEHMEFCHRERGSRACRPRASVGTDMAWIDFGHVKFDSQTSSSIVSGSHNGMLHGLQSLSELLQIVVDTGGELSQKWDWERDEQRVSK